MDTDKHRFCRPRPGLGPLGLRSLSGEKILDVGKPVSKRLSSVFICVYLWLE